MAIAIMDGGVRLRLLAPGGVTPVEGGGPIVAGGRMVGAVGVSGVTSAQVARAGAETAAR